MKLTSSILLYLSILFACKTPAIESSNKHNFLPEFNFSQAECKQQSKYFTLENEDSPLRYKWQRNYGINIDKNQPYFLEIICRKRVNNSKIILNEEVVFKITNNDTIEVFQKKEYSKSIDLYYDEYLFYNSNCSDEIVQPKLPNKYCWKYSYKHQSAWLIRRNQLKLDSSLKTLPKNFTICGSSQAEIQEKDFPYYNFVFITQSKVDSIINLWLNLN